MYRSSKLLSFFLSQSQPRCVCIIALQAYMHYVVYIYIWNLKLPLYSYWQWIVYLQSGNTKGNVHMHLHYYKGHHTTLTHTCTLVRALSHFRQSVASLEQNGTSTSGLERRQVVTRLVLLPIRRWSWMTRWEGLQFSTGRSRTMRANSSSPTSQKEFSKSVDICGLWRKEGVLDGYIGTKRSWCNIGYHLRTKNQR